MIDAKTKLCAVLGNPVQQSLSPIIHNAAYKSLGLNYVFLAFKVTDVKKALDGLRELEAVGIAVTIPHKLEVLKFVDEIDEVTKEIGAANTILNIKGRLKASNTDWTGALKALEEKTTLINKHVALLGAGGAARAVAYGLAKKKAKVSIFNRTYQNALRLVKDFQLVGAYPISDFQMIKNSDIIINTTSVGMLPGYDSLIPESCITSGHVVFDIVYKPKETKLIQYSKRKRATIVYGYKMLLYQAIAQFEIFTGKTAPFDIMEKALLTALQEQSRER